jgi:hypothetical protein
MATRIIRVSTHGRRRARTRPIATMVMIPI